MEGFKKVKVGERKYEYDAILFSFPISL